MTDTTSAYSLLPWVRRGIASHITGTPAVNYATIALSLWVNGAPVAAPPHVRLPGPGDVKSVDARAFIRTDPRDGADNFEPNFLASIDMATPDFPWMFTPTAPDGERLQPWICLIVVPEGEGVSLTPQPGGPDTLQLAAPLDLVAILPDLSQIDAWAHVQLAGTDLSEAALEQANGASLSRLISPCRLVPSQRYLGCVVPTYRAGAHAGLGFDVADDDLDPAWSATTAVPFKLPVYFHFRFQTGPAGDFASLARKIGPPITPIVAGTRTIDVSKPGFGMSAVPGLTLELEGALRTFQMPLTPWPPNAQDAYESELRRVLSPPAAPDPVVAPPIFGGTQMSQALPSTDTQLPLWLSELNLDPRSRVAASAAGAVVQAGADAMVASAWAQLGEIRRANRLLRQGQLAREVLSSMNRRHLQTIAGDGTYLQVTSPTHARVTLTLVGASATLFGHVKASRVPVSAMSGAMRKLARPRGPLGRQITKIGPQQIVDRLNLPTTGTTPGLVIAPPARRPAGMVTLDDVSPSLQMVKMNPVVLRRSTGWHVLQLGGARATGLPAGYMPVVTTIKPGVGTVLPFAPIAPVRPTEPVIDPIKPVIVPIKPTLPVIPIIDWQVDPNVPPILRTSDKASPAPMVFPADEVSLGKAQEHFRTAAMAVTGYLATAIPAVVDPPSLCGSSALSTTRSSLGALLNPTTTITARIRARVTLASGSDPLQPLMGVPQFPQAMYEPLAELSQEWMLPGISNVLANSAVLLQTNPKFVEAYLVGLNEELARELLWRQFPAERAQTWFRNFWTAGGTPDIPSIAQFDPAAHLGDHTQDHAHPGRLVLLVRAALFRRYPNALFSAAPAVWNNGKTARELGDARQWPVFQGHIGEDVRFFGFDIDDPFGNPDSNANEPGWYFVLEEHVTEPRFGLEPATVAPGSAGASWNDLGWDAMTAPRFIDPSTPPAFTAIEPVPWSQNSAAMAFILMRRPVRVAMHASALVAAGKS